MENDEGMNKSTYKLNNSKALQNVLIKKSRTP
jgi:hypothetical protein